MQGTTWKCIAASVAIALEMSSSAFEMEAFWSKQQQRYSKMNALHLKELIEIESSFGNMTDCRTLSNSWLNFSVYDNCPHWHVTPLQPCPLFPWLMHLRLTRFKAALSWAGWQIQSDSIAFILVSCSLQSVHHAIIAWFLRFPRSWTCGLSVFGKKNSMLQLWGVLSFCGGGQRGAAATQRRELGWQVGCGFRAGGRSHFDCASRLMGVDGRRCWLMEIFRRFWDRGVVFCKIKFCKLESI